MNWYCLHTRPQKEFQTVGYLNTRFGLEVYYPRLRQRKTIRRVRREVISPLFPRYLFCRFDPALHFRAIRYGHEIIGIVSFGDQPAIVSDSLIQGLKDWAGDEVDLISADQELQPGEPVTIIDGPMQGFRAVVLHAKSGRDRVTVLLSLLECAVPMVTSRSSVVRIHK